MQPIAPMQPMSAQPASPALHSLACYANSANLGGRGGKATQQGQGGGTLFYADKSCYKRSGWLSGLVAMLAMIALGSRGGKVANGGLVCLGVLRWLELARKHSLHSLLSHKGGHNLKAYRWAPAAPPRLAVRPPSLPHAQPYSMLIFPTVKSQAY